MGCKPSSFMHNLIVSFHYFTPLEWDFPFLSPLSRLPDYKWITAFPSSLQVTQPQIIQSTITYLISSEQQRTLVPQILYLLHATVIEWLARKMATQTKVHFLAYLAGRYGHVMKVTMCDSFQKPSFQCAPLPILVTFLILPPRAEILSWIVRMRAVPQECHQVGELEGDPGSQGLLGAELAALPTRTAKSQSLRHKRELLLCLSH